jgi:hypothetical protein
MDCPHYLIVHRFLLLGEGIQMRGIHLTERNKEILDLAYSLKNTKLKGKPKDCKAAFSWAPHSRIIKDLYVDLSQNLNYLTVKTFPTLAKNSVMFSFERDSVIFPEEHFALHGYDRSMIPNPDALLDTEVRSLTGDAMSLPILYLCLAQVVLNGEFDGIWTCDADSDRDEVAFESRDHTLQRRRLARAGLQPIAAAP